MKCVSNDYTNPNINSKTLTALTLTLRPSLELYLYRFCRLCRYHV